MLRMRTGYSFREAFGKLEDYMELCKDYTYAPITDRNAYSWGKWNELCKQNNVIPVMGLEIAVSPDIYAKKPIVDYWLFFSNHGIEHLTALMALATEQFRYQPLLTYEQAINA